MIKKEAWKAVVDESFATVELFAFGQVNFCFEGCPVHYWMYIGIPGHPYPLGQPNCLQNLSNIPWEEKHCTWLRNTALQDKTGSDKKSEEVSIKFTVKNKIYS